MYVGREEVVKNNLMNNFVREHNCRFRSGGKSVEPDGYRIRFQSHGKGFAKITTVMRQ